LDLRNESSAQAYCLDKRAGHRIAEQGIACDDSQIDQSGILGKQNL